MWPREVRVAPDLSALQEQAGRRGRCHMNFFLGVHHANWLALTNVPLFVSARSLLHRRTLPRSAGSWCMDSMGFNELRQHGAYTLTPRSYAALAMRCASEVGGLVWAAIQDWMCEPVILSRTGLSL